MSRVREVADRYPQVVKDWIEFLDCGEDFEDFHYDSLSFGFFLGKGIEINDALVLSLGWDNLRQYV